MFIFISIAHAQEEDAVQFRSAQQCLLIRVVMTSSWPSASVVCQVETTSVWESLSRMTISLGCWHDAESIAQYCLANSAVTLYNVARFNYSFATNLHSIKLTCTDIVELAIVAHAVFLQEKMFSETCKKNLDVSHNDWWGVSSQMGFLTPTICPHRRSKVILLIGWS